MITFSSAPLRGTRAKERELAQQTESNTTTLLWCWWRGMRAHEATNLHGTSAPRTAAEYY